VTCHGAGRRRAGQPWPPEDRGDRGKWRPVNGTLGFGLDLDCMDVKGSAKLGTAIGTAVSIDTNENGSWGAKTEGRLAVRGCTRF